MKKVVLECVVRVLGWMLQSPAHITVLEVSRWRTIEVAVTAVQPGDYEREDECFSSSGRSES